MLVDYLDHYFVFNKSFKIKLNSAMTSFCPLLFLAIFSTAWALEQRAVYYWFYFVILFEHPGTESVNNVFLLYPNYVVFLFFFKYHQIESRADLFVDGIDADLFFFSDAMLNLWGNVFISLILWNSVHHFLALN